MIWNSQQLKTFDREDLRIFILFVGMVIIKCEKWNISCCISKQRMSQSSEIADLQCEPVSTDETQDV